MTISERMERVQKLMAYDEQYCGIVSGMDEAGRGPLAGNVWAACVVMPKKPVLIWVDDSKKLSESRREKVYEEIIQHALYIGTGKCSPEEIDEINILEATKRAMREAAGIIPADIFLIDAVSNLGLNGREIPVIKGDTMSYSIAAASIVAKVTRDREMRLMDELFPEYGFSKNKGYGTPDHIAALRKYGPCPIHRKTFIGHFTA